MGWKEFLYGSTDVPRKTPEVQVVEKVVEKVPDHTHEWTLTSKTYAAPRKEVQGLGLSEALIEKAMFGVTTLLWECSVCQQLRKEEALGTDEQQLEVVLDNAARLGPQYLERESGMYIVAKWQAPVQSSQAQPEYIPVR